MRLKNNLYSVNAIHQSEEGLSCTIHLMEESPVYKAHFPTQPVTPGACIVQIAVEIYEGFKGLSGQEFKGIDIVKVKNAKFLKAMIPGGGRSFRYSIREEPADDALTHLQVVVTSDDVIYAKLSLICKDI